MIATTERPDWLTQALRTRTESQMIPTVAKSDRGDLPMAPGQVHRLDPMDPGIAEPRLVLLTEVDNDGGMATVVVLSSEVEAGSDVDRLLPRKVSGLAYDLVVLSDVSGPVWLVQLGPLLTVVNVAIDDLPAAGIPLKGEADSRWTWKETQIDALVALTAECRFQLIDGESAAVVDPVAFDLSAVDVMARSRMTLAAVQMLERDDGFVPAEALAIEAVGKSSIAFESFEALWRVVPRHRDRVLPLSRLPAGEAPVLRTVVNDPLPAVLWQIAARLDDSMRCIHITTVSSLWRDDVPHGNGFYRAVSLGGRRHQLVVSHVDLAGVHGA